MLTKTGQNISKAIEILMNDGIIAIPTETVYGLACNALSEKAVSKIYKLKGREFKNPLSIQFDSFEKINFYVKSIPEAYYKIAEKFCPGPVTFIFDKNQLIPDFVNAGKQTIGIRIPSHYLALEILKNISFPLAVTSANISGKADATTAGEVRNYFKNKIPYIVDGGKCFYSKPSTVIQFSENKIIILRKGVIYQ